MENSNSNSNSNTTLSRKFPCICLDFDFKLDTIYLGDFYFKKDTFSYYPHQYTLYQRIKCDNEGIKYDVPITEKDKIADFLVSLPGDLFNRDAVKNYQLENKGENGGEITPEYLDKVIFQNEENYIQILRYYLRHRIIKVEDIYNINNNIFRNSIRIHNRALSTIQDIIFIYE